MLKKNLIGCFYFVFFLAFSAHAGYLPPPASPFPKAENPFYNDTVNTALSSQRLLNYFTTIRVAGNIDIDIKTGMNQSQIIFTGDPRDIAHIHTTVVNDTLTIMPEPKYPYYGKVHADVYTQFLNGLILRNYPAHLNAINLNSPYINLDLAHSGSVVLSGKIGVNHLDVSSSGTTQIHDVQSNALYIHMKDNPTVDITGVANVRLIEAEGSGNLRLYWVDSDLLTINQRGNTHIQLAGIAKRLEAELWNKAYFNGRYLRVKVSYIKTHDLSIAHIQSLKSRAAVAYDNSTIGFFGKPPFRSDLMANNGAVLDMKPPY